MSLKEDIDFCRKDIRECWRPRPCESCEILSRILDALEKRSRVLWEIGLARERGEEASVFSLRNIARETIKDDRA